MGATFKEQASESDVRKCTGGGSSLLIVDPGAKFNVRKNGKKQSSPEKNRRASPMCGSAPVAAPRYSSWILVPSSMLEKNGKKQSSPEKNSTALLMVDSLADLTEFEDSIAKILASGARRRRRRGGRRR